VKMSVFIVGASGRMGRRIAACAEGDPRVRRVVPWSRGADPGSEMRSEKDCDIVVDFSSPEGLSASVALALHLRAPLLVGTTGLTNAHLEAPLRAAKDVPVMVAPNTSVGVAVLGHLVAEASRMLPDEFDVAITEHHHRAKRDAPSGTALRLAERLRESGRKCRDVAPIFAIRGGDVPGTHEIHFAGQQQTLMLRHAAESRDVFAIGALHAAAWLCGRAPGSYRFEESVGIPITEPSGGPSAPSR